jgi:pyruvate-formate lyase
MPGMSFDERIAALRKTKHEHTAAKRGGSPRDGDDHGVVPLPANFTFTPEEDPDMFGFKGGRMCGRNYRLLLEKHPTYIDPMSSLACAWMTTLGSYRCPHWNPDHPYTHLMPEQKKYNIVHGIGGGQHFGPDMLIGFELGWGGMLEKVRTYRDKNAPHGAEMYAGWEDVILGIQNWIGRNAEAARRAALTEERLDLREDLETMAEMCERLVTEPPRTFRDACQWITFFMCAARIHNGSGALGQLDELLRPYYERDTAAGILDDEEAIFHIACMLIKDTHYSQIGGPAPDGADLTSRVSFLILEAIHRMGIPANIAIRLHDGLDPKLYELGVKYLFEDNTNSPLFVGDKGLTEGFVRNGYPIELARRRVKVGCHWCAIPGREYTLNDIVKINFAKVFDVALREMTGDESVENTTEELWRRFEDRLRRAIEVTAEGIDFHMQHMYKTYPELVLDLFCHGTIEQGLDITQKGAVEYYNMCMDGSALATTADSFAALEQRIEQEKRLTWDELMQHLDNDFADAEDIRLIMKSIPRYGSGGSRADDYALKISRTFTKLVKEKPTPDGFNLVPGLFSWASTVQMGRKVGATPNGRHAGAPISHGANPDPGFVKDGPQTAAALAVAAVQPGYGNSAPLQLDLDFSLGRTAENRAKVAALMKTHFDLGGTQININILDKKQLLDAEKHPEKYPDLMVRVTGFSAYFSLLSPAFRRWVIERIYEV